MRKKRVVLCEGQHDLIFLSLLLGAENQSVVSKNWGQICGASDLSGESVTIKNFLRSRCTASYLLKQDENRNTCIHQMWIIYSYEREYPIKVVLDSDNGVTLDTLKNEMHKKMRKDLLNQESSNLFRLKKEEESGVFLYPVTLTKEVKRVTGKALDSVRGVDLQKEILQEFISNAPEWVHELRDFLLH
ncbi:MAG: hypothetical protein IJD81_11520 [Oscillospiraceae bacterium]|nr:hypothetical protein [Oscillospiraceae bacterium]